MKLSVTNSNYCATVVKVHTILPLDNCDNVVDMPMFGCHAIVSKDVQVGDIGILFTAETQLSEDYCKNNNLFRHAELNKDKDQKGYIEDNRRIRAVKFRGHGSSALFMPLNSLDYLRQHWKCWQSTDLKEGDTFDSITDVEICKKYEIRRGNGRGNHVGGKDKVFEKVDVKLFPEHLDSENYFRNLGKYKDNDIVIITQKLHGTSGRRGYVKCKRPLSFMERIYRFFGAKIENTFYDYIAGSRRVIKGQEGNQHYYDADIRQEWLGKIKTVIPKNHVIYGEIIGWIGEKPIQKSYTYQVPQGTSEMYVYRIAVINDDGYSVDYTRKQLMIFCKNNGLKHVPELREGFHINAKIDAMMDKTFCEIGYGGLPLDKDSPCDEGVCVRIDDIQPYITKAKSQKFLEHETKMLDSGEEDLESNQSEDGEGIDY